MILYFDFETTNLDYGSAYNPDNRIVMVAWAVEDGIVNYYYGDITRASGFWCAVDICSVLCAHNARFEQAWMKRLGFDIHSKQWHDTMLAERVLAGNRQMKLDLGSVAARHGEDAKDPYVDKLIKDGVCPSDIDKAALVSRCVRDVRSMRAVLQKQMRMLKKRGQLHLYRNRSEFLPILTEMTSNGMHLDAERVKTAYKAAQEDMAYLGTQLDAMTGGINLRSPAQMAHYLYEDLGFPERVGANGKPKRNKPSKQFPDGVPLTDKSTLGWLASQATTEKQKEFLLLRSEYGKAAARLSKNLEFFQGVCDEYNGTFRANFNQCIAATHRLTSSGLPLTFSDGKKRSVQFQNMPREFKPLFVAPDGDYFMVEVDASQLEFRVAAFCGQDEQAMKDILDPDFDAHLKSASVMNEIDYDYLLACYRGENGKERQKWAKSLRQDAKSDTFKPLYGGEKGTPAQEKWYKAFRERYPGIDATQQAWLSDVVANSGCLRLPWGMRFYWNTYEKYGTLFDTIKHKPVFPQVANYPVQNLATAEIVPIAIISLFRRCRQAGLRVIWLNTIHDSVICYVHKEDFAKFTKLVKPAFTTDVYNYLKIRYNIDFNVPLGCEIVYGKHWSEGEEVVYDDAKKGT